MKVYHVTQPVLSFTLPDPLWSVQCGRGEHKYKILEIFGGFDIETTNIQNVEGWSAFAYHFQISLANQRETFVYLFRSWDVWLWFIEFIADHYGTGPDTKLILWVANLSFEFQFIRRRLKWDQGDFDFFAKEERQPLKATYRGIEFREALAISGGNLDHLAKTFCKTKKLVTTGPNGEKISDLDYRKERNSSTPLTDIEEQYCINDVVILSEFSQYMFNHYIRPDKRVPMTKTSILITEYKEQLKLKCRAIDRVNGLEYGTTLDTWKAFLLRCFPDQEHYSLWFKYLFRGGYVHANILYTDIVIPCKMRDITSSYPAEMNLSYYPVTPFKKVKFKPEYLKSKCCILHCFYDYIGTTTPHTIESKNKVVDAVGGKWDNGRLIWADTLEVYLTELDYDIYQKFYTTPYPPTISECWIAERGKLPFYLLDTLNKYYIHKHQLKVAGLSDTQEYSVTKERVNSNYGASVKKIKLDKITYTDDWGHDAITPNYKEEISKQVLLPQWGIWVTAQARHSLLTMLYRLTMAGVKVVYMDTDSIKYVPSHKAEQIFKHYNNQKSRRLHNRKLRNIAFNDLGFFDKEEKGKTVQFKTLGAKRYLYYNGEKIKATVAGMPKVAINALGQTPEEVFAAFSRYGYELKPEVSGKLTTRYRDEPYSGAVYYKGVPEIMHEESGVALYQIPFTMTITQEYRAYMEEKKEERPSL
jgi:hypothetical protein